LPLMAEALAPSFSSISTLHHEEFMPASSHPTPTPAACHFDSECRRCRRPCKHLAATTFGRCVLLRNKWPGVTTRALAVLHRVKRSSRAIIFTPDQQDSEAV
jgi:hypothetical protein